MISHLVMNVPSLTLSIMVSLMWWGLADEGQGWQHSSWRAALEDVHWVLDALLADHE